MPKVFGNGRIYDESRVSDYAEIYNDVILRGNSRVSGFTKIGHQSTLRDVNISDHENLS